MLRYPPSVGKLNGANVPIMVTCVDRVAVRVAFMRGGCEVATFREHEIPEGEHSELINLTSAEVLACFVGPTLARSAAVARLTPGQRAKLYPNAGTRRHAWQLAAIGRAITDPIVVAQLAREPLHILRAVAQHRDPEAQLFAAVKARANHGVRSSRVSRATPKT